jgi:hypothetical protein
LTRALIGVNAATRPAPTMVATNDETPMSTWPELAKWLAVAAGIVLVLGVAVLGVLSWLLTHPRD